MIIKFTKHDTDSILNGLDNDEQITLVNELNQYDENTISVADDDANEYGDSSSYQNERNEYGEDVWDFYNDDEITDLLNDFYEILEKERRQQLLQLVEDGE